MRCSFRLSKLNKDGLLGSSYQNIAADLFFEIILQSAQFSLHKSTAFFWVTSAARWLPIHYLKCSQYILMLLWEGQIPVTKEQQKAKFSGGIVDYISSYISQIHFESRILETYSLKPTFRSWILKTDFLKYQDE